MRICIVAGYLPGQAVGGATGTYVTELARQLAERGHEIVIVGCRKSQPFPNTVDQRLDAELVQVTRLRVPILKTLITNVLVVFTLARLHRLRRFDIIQIQDFASSLLFYLIGRYLLRNCLVLQNVHAAVCYEILFDGRYRIAECGQRRKRWQLTVKMHVSYWMAKQMQALALGCCDAAIADSTFDRAQVRHFFGRAAAEKTKVIPIGVDTERFSLPVDKVAIRSCLGLPADRPILLTVRRLVPRMGLFALIGAMAELRRDFPQVMLCVVGAGPMREELERLVLELDLTDKVRFAGYVPDSELADYYRAADLFVLPTEQLEGFGIVTLEALASGLAVLGTHKGATPRILGPLSKNLVINDSDAESITNRIRSWLLSPERFPGSAECRTYVERNYAWETVISQYIIYIESESVRKRVRSIG